MTQTRSRAWVEVLMVVMTLAISGALLYALLPFVTAPDQVVVPPPQEMELTQTLLTLFVVATAIGAPVTAGIVLALVFRFVSKRVPASSSVAPEIPTVKPKPKTQKPVKEMSRGKTLFWKALAAVLVIAVSALALTWLAISFAQAYGLIQ